MVDLIHPHVRDAILRHVAVRTCHVEHEAQAVAIEIADAAKHDVSAWSRWHPYSADGLSSSCASLAIPNSLRWADRPARSSVPSVKTLLYRTIVFSTTPPGRLKANMICGPVSMVMARGKIARFRRLASTDGHTGDAPGF
jgi:hypothetical protein